MNRWAKNGVFDRVFAPLQQEQLVRVKLEAVSMASPIVKVHPDGTGVLKKNGPQAIGKSRGGRTTKIHLVAAGARTAVTLSLSPGQAHDVPAGRQRLRRLGGPREKLLVLMYRAYEGTQKGRSAPRRPSVIPDVCYRESTRMPRHPSVIPDICYRESTFRSALAIEKRWNA